jgi:hypothetical protein
MFARALLVTLCFQAAALSAAAQNPLGMTFGKTTINVTGLEPGGSAIVFGVSRAPIPGAYMDRVERWQATVEDVRRDGTAAFDVGKEIPAESVWAVVDLRNGRYVTRAGGGAAVVTMRGNPLRRGSADPDRFAFDHGYLLLLYVHPGMGAWTWYAMDGTRTDIDGSSNGTTMVALSDGKSLGAAGKAPKTFALGGLLVAIDYVHLEAAVVRVDEALLGAAR